MMLAYDYPLLGVFWTMLWFFLFFVWIWILIQVFVDIFRSDDLSGWGKAGWVILVVVLPFLGVLFYLIFRGGKMQERRMQSAARQQEEFRQYVQDVATAPGGSADQLAKLADLRERGVITDAEFQVEKPRSCPDPYPVQNTLLDPGFPNGARNYAPSGALRRRRPGGRTDHARTKRRTDRRSTATATGLNHCPEVS